MFENQDDGALGYFGDPKAAEDVKPGEARIGGRCGPKADRSDGDVPNRGRGRIAQ